MELASVYGHAIASVLIWVLLVQYLTIRTGIGKANANLVPGSMPEASYDDPLYRLSRAYLNTNEVLAVFATVVVMCILTGANPFWVNVLASAALVARILMVVVHLRAVGKRDNGARTMLFGLGWALNVALACFALAAVFW